MAYESKYQTLIEQNAPLLHRDVIDSMSGANNKYDTLEFPSGVLGSTKYPHYTIFYINEFEKSAKQDNKPQINSINTTSKTANNTMTASLNGNVGSFKTNNPVSPYSSDLLQTGINAGKNLAGGVMNSIKGAVAQYSAQKKRMQTAICLPMPHHIRASYGAEYQATDKLGAFGAVIAAAISPNSDTADTLKFALAPVAAGAVTEMAKSGVGNVSTALANAIPSGADVEKRTSQILTKMSGRVLSGRQEQLFNNMNFRTHQFSYLFVPKTQDDSDQISRIIYTLKYYMHPELSAGTGSSLLITPAEFDIEFRNGENENQSLHKIATCALKNIEVNYTAIGEFIAFAGTDNPVAISIDMTFVEMEPLNRAMIKKYGF
jgi:hypothetical protein